MTMLLNAALWVDISLNRLYIHIYIYNLFHEISTHNACPTIMQHSASATVKYIYTNIIIYKYICSIIRDNVTYESFRVLDYL